MNASQRLHRFVLAAPGQPLAAWPGAFVQRWLRLLLRLRGPLPALLLAGCLVCLALLQSPRAQAWDAQQMRAAAQRLGPAAVAALLPLQNMLTLSKSQDDSSRLLAVNEFFNLRVSFASDLDVWGQNDYWATPLQSLAMGRGDCEDYVIAKYTLLLAMGVPRHRLRLVYVRARVPDEPEPIAHMVLAYYATPAAEPLLLDNMRAEVLPASMRADLTPVFSFNSDGLWQGVGQSAAGDPMARLSRWRDCWQRIQLEGFF